MNGDWGISYEIALRWIPLDLTDDKSIGSDHGLVPSANFDPDLSCQMATLGFESTLVYAMVCCPAALSHYLNQCWLVISKVPWHSPESNFTVNAQATTVESLECHYNPVQFIMVFHTALQWQQQNVNQTSNSQQTIAHPYRQAMGCLLWEFLRKLTML